MTVNSTAFTALMTILSTKQPISARNLIDAMRAAGHAPTVARQVIQLAFERGRIRLDGQMRVVIVEQERAAA